MREQGSTAEPRHDDMVSRSRPVSESRRARPEASRKTLRVWHGVDGGKPSSLSIKSGSERASVARERCGTAWWGYDTLTEVLELRSRVATDAILWWLRPDGVFRCVRQATLMSGAAHVTGKAAETTSRTFLPEAGIGCQPAMFCCTGIQGDVSSVIRSTSATAKPRVAPRPSNDRGPEERQRRYWGQ